MPTQSSPPMIVFSDLDGTLLDHDTYSYAPAQPALAALARKGIPLVLASSKTAAEIAPLRDELGFADVPAIVENGAGQLAPGDAGLTGGDYDRLCAAIKSLPPDIRCGFKGFSDMGVEGISAETGLAAADAARAAQRQFSEPGIWTRSDAAKALFLAALREKGVQAREGGRFLTLSFGGTKAAQMDSILARYGRPFSVALGDAPNDTEMLETADLGIIVANPHRPPLPTLKGEAEGHIRRTEDAGPKGWNAAVQQVMVERQL